LYPAISVLERIFCMSFFTLKNQRIARLVELSTELKQLGAISALLSWDQETYLPPKSAYARAKQLSVLAGITHDKATAGELKKLLDDLAADIVNTPSAFTEGDRALVRVMQRDLTYATKLPRDLVTTLADACTIGLEAWKDAREGNRFETYLPQLERMVKLKREVGERLGYQGSPYDALLDEYEEGLTKVDVVKAFEPLKTALETRIPKFTEETKAFDTGVLKQSFDSEKLWELSMRVLTDLGFDMERGRQDVSVHPFTIGLHPTDVRLTTRILETNPVSTLLSTIHEGGHGLYEQGINPEFADTTLGQVTSLVLHESQSRFFENMIGRSREFWEWLFPKMLATFPNQLGTTDALTVWREANRVHPSLVRVDADEVTYPMHIIIRFEIESALIEGTLAPKDVPEKWNELYLQYLGIRVPNDHDGCLQDIHWSQGLIGYFPTYLLGSLLSAQLRQAMLHEHPSLPSDIRAGKFERPRKWLHRAIHQHGRVYGSQELAQRVTGSPVAGEAFLGYIDQKFTQLAKGA
jgi:carboxypeptidase Taq